MWRTPRDQTIFLGSYFSNLLDDDLLGTNGSVRYNTIGHMPIYIFQRGDETTQVVGRMADIASLVDFMENLGWRRIWTLPSVIMYLSYTEALEESVREAEENDRQAAQGRLDGTRMIAEALREEGL